MTMTEPVRLNSSSAEDRAESVLRYNIRKYLRALGISQNSLMEVLGLTSGAISQLMTGRTQFKYKQVAAIANYLNVTIADLSDETYYRQDEEFMAKMHESDERFKKQVLMGRENKKATGDTPMASDGLLRLGLNQRPSD